MGNEALAIRGHLRRAGFASDIFAAWADPRMAGMARTLEECREAATADSVLLFHFGCGSPAGRLAFEAPARLALIYHNVTPARFFELFAPGTARELREGRRELARFVPRASLALAKSSFSREELDELGFEPTALLPYVLDPGLYRKTPSAVVKRLFPADRANVLVVGRVAPNKRIEDILGCFAVYQRNLERRSRLLVVGETRGTERYAHSLMGLSRKLGLRDAFFVGQVTQEELLAYYAVADVLLSLSEHEGFGVPLVEGMMLGVPVVAFEAGAVAETLGGSGVLLKDKSPGVVAAVLDALRCNTMLRAGVVARQRRVAEQILAVDSGASLLESLAPLLA